MKYIELWHLWILGVITFLGLVFIPEITGFIVLGLLFLIAYFIPTLIGFKRRHHYKFIILGLNIIGFVGIVPWIAAFIWAAWPKDKSLFDPIAGDVTGKSNRNIGDTIGSIKYGLKDGYDKEKEFREKNSK